MKIQNSLFLLIGVIFVASGNLMCGQGEKSIIAEDQPRSFLGRKTGTWTPGSKQAIKAEIIAARVTNQKELLENLKNELEQAANNNDKKAAIAKAFQFATADTKETLDKAHNDPMNAISIINDRLNQYAQEGIYPE